MGGQGISARSDVGSGIAIGASRGAAEKGRAFVEIHWLIVPSESAASAVIVIEAGAPKVALFAGLAMETLGSAFTRTGTAALVAIAPSLSRTAVRL